MTGRGFNPLKDYLPLARNEGYFALFQQRAEENAKTYVRKAKGRYDTRDLEYLRAMLNSAANINSQVVLIIYPYHAQILALFEESGLLPYFSQWKSDLVKLADNVKQQNPHADIKIFDFSGYGQFQCEHIPEKGDKKTKTYWYWEGGHFKKNLGDLVLGQILSSTIETEADINPNAFGVVLNQNNLSLNNQRMDREKQQCVKDYPQLFSDAQALISKFRY
jgi:hypothetical protein